MTTIMTAVVDPKVSRNMEKLVKLMILHRKAWKNNPSQGRTLRLVGFGDFGALAGRSRMETAYGSGVARCRNWLSVALFPWQKRGWLGLGAAWNSQLSKSSSMMILDNVGSVF